MAEADKFGAALLAVRRAIRDQSVAPGEALLVDSLARRLRMSATPIREALAYLSGTGVAERQGRGYRVRRLEPCDVRELYQLHSAYVRMALDMLAVDGQDAGSTPIQVEPEHEQTYQVDVEAFWNRLTVATGHNRLQCALRRLADQLALVRMAEPQVFADVKAELVGLKQLRAAGSPTAFRAAVEAYHLRRTASDTALSAAIRWPRSAGKI